MNPYRELNLRLDPATFVTLHDLAQQQGRPPEDLARDVLLAVAHAAPYRPAALLQWPAVRKECPAR